MSDFPVKWPDPNCGYTWTDKEWSAWRAANAAVCSLGGTIGTAIYEDGSAEEWAEINGVRVRCDPQWIMSKGEDGSDLFGVSSL